MTTFSICIRCGAEKKYPMAECQICHFQPMDDEDKAKSLMLSIAYEIDTEYRGKSIDELKAIARDTQAGKPYTFAAEEIQSIIAWADRARAITGKDLFIDLVKWVGPALLWIAVMLVLGHYGGTH